jgi:hypothetical protein
LDIHCDLNDLQSKSKIRSNPLNPWHPRSIPLEIAQFPTTLSPKKVS